MWSLANSQAFAEEQGCHPEEGQVPSAEHLVPSPAAAASMGSALTLETTGIEPLLCFLESQLLTVLNGEAEALTAEAPVGFPGRCGYHTADLSRAAHALPRCRLIQSCVWNPTASAYSQHDGVLTMSL